MDLLSAPDEAQRLLLDIVWSDYAHRGDWPIFQYVEAKLDQEPGGPPASDVLLSCPRIPIGHGPGHYGWLWLENANLYAPQPGDTLGLTVAGMSRLTQASEEAHLFLTVLRALVERGRSFTPNPTTVQTVEATSAEVKGFLLPKLGYGPLRDQVTRLGEMLRHEPSTWGMVSPSAADNTWVATLKPSLRAYDGIQDADDYVRRLAAAISPARPEAPPVLVSALALPEAIDYLNAIWRLRENEPLFLISRSESAAKLAFECNGPDEFDSRLTSLYGILCATRVPGMAGNRKPGDLKTYLTKRLPPGGRPRALAAIADLQDFLSGRAWRHHADADRGIAAMQRLGVRLPTDDWSLAWRTLQTRMVKALNDLREEVEVIAPPAERVRSV